MLRRVASNTGCPFGAMYTQDCPGRRVAARTRASKQRRPLCVPTEKCKHENVFTYAINAKIAKKAKNAKNAKALRPRTLYKLAMMSLVVSRQKTVGQRFRDITAKSPRTPRGKITWLVCFAILLNLLFYLGVLCVLAVGFQKKCAVKSDKPDKSVKSDKRDKSDNPR